MSGNTYKEEAKVMNRSFSSPEISFFFSLDTTNSRHPVYTHITCVDDHIYIYINLGNLKGNIGIA